MLCWSVRLHYPTSVLLRMDGRVREREGERERRRSEAQSGVTPKSRPLNKHTAHSMFVYFLLHCRVRVREKEERETQRCRISEAL